MRLKKKKQVLLVRRFHLDFSVLLEMAAELGQHRPCLVVLNTHTGHTLLHPVFDSNPEEASASFLCLLTPNFECGRWCTPSFRLISSSYVHGWD